MGMVFVLIQKYKKIILCFVTSVTKNSVINL